MIKRRGRGEVKKSRNEKFHVKSKSVSVQRRKVFVPIEDEDDLEMPPEEIDEDWNEVELKSTDLVPEYSDPL